ncbi:hypothetical protein IFM89_003015 [Coptis chinensis]|uniref:TPX2 C-terminal domain-containing protein n=1 Tax=Coptis chinensis TaxID=261450 RepID=A0A835ISQ7_9MAGN|nr:hypothetical protein IFM89_003015 [Coptis chinensis]
MANYPTGLDELQRRQNDVKCLTYHVHFLLHKFSSVHNVQASQKPPTKERAKPVEIKLHTQQRAVKRAGFNYLIECKMTMIEHQRQQEEMFRRVIKLIYTAFYRSTRPLTVPRDPSFHSFNSKLWRCKSPSESYSFQRFTHQSSKPIK